MKKIILIFASVIFLISCGAIDVEIEYDNDNIEIVSNLVKIDPMAVFELVYASNVEEKILYIGSSDCTLSQDFLYILESVALNAEKTIYHYDIYLEEDYDLVFETLYLLNAFFTPIILRIKDEDVVDYFVGYNENLEYYLLNLLEIDL